MNDLMSILRDAHRIADLETEVERLRKQRDDYRALMMALYHRVTEAEKIIDELTHTYNEEVDNG